MGAFSSTLGRRNGGVEVVDISSNNAYRYPPKSGNYFGSHFIMGGERFDMSQPESYLFGENTDLNFLGNKPVPFPYPPATGNEPTKTLKSLVNIRKDTLRLVRIPEEEKLQPEGTDETLGNRYNLEFTFDSDVKCSVKVLHFCTEEIINGQINYQSRDPSLSSETFHYKRGAGHVFQQSSYIIDPSAFSEEELQYCPDKDEMPMVILCTAEDDDGSQHAHMTFAVIERSSLDGCYVIKPLKQKQFVHGLCYLLQEIYGIENKTEKIKDDDGDDDDLEDSGAECVICMSDMRDTLILPCRHLCLCSTCAESLRYQASSCPICRSPFRALLQIRAMRRKQAVALQQSGDQTMEETPVSQEGVPPGYEAVSLIEALNGPCGLPPFNTMEGIHVPPPSRFQTTETESRHKRRSSKKRNIAVETVKELMMSEDDKKIQEDKDGERTDTSVKTDTSVPITEPPKSPGQKQRNRSGRHKKATGDSVSMPRSASSDQENKEDSVHMVNEKKMIPRKNNSMPEICGQKELTVPYPPLTISSENLADDEREDTSEGEIEPEPDYDLDEHCCGLSDERLDSLASGTDLTETISDSSAFVPPPDYATVMCEESTVGDTEPDTDDGSVAPVKLHLSTSPPSSTDSACSNHSSHVLLPGSNKRQSI
ncbi:hypothetical protein ACF0H5_000835 [Mactra antiquata]